MLQWAQIREEMIYRSRTALSQMLKFNVFGNICIKIESEKFLNFALFFHFQPYCVRWAHVMLTQGGAGDAAAAASSNFSDKHLIAASFISVGPLCTSNELGLFKNSSSLRKKQSLSHKVGLLGPPKHPTHIIVLLILADN